MVKTKEEQLGMNPSTARAKLHKALLWKYIEKSGEDHCCKCGEKMTLDDYSIEHVTPWLHDDNAVDLFFNLDNISFSHLKCNISSARRKRKYNTPEEALAAKYRKAREWKVNNRVYSPEERRRRYLSHGN